MKHLFFCTTLLALFLLADCTDSTMAPQGSAAIPAVIPIVPTPQVLGKRHLPAIFVTLMCRFKSVQYYAILIQQYQNYTILCYIYAIVAKLSD
jgi:hypothetical protein